MDVEVLCVVVVWLGVAWVCLIDLGFGKLDFGLNVVDFVAEVADLVEERAETVVHGGSLICELLNCLLYFLLCVQNALNSGVVRCTIDC